MMRNRLQRIGPVLGLVLLLVSLLVPLVGCSGGGGSTPLLGITTTSPLPPGAVNHNYNQLIQATGGKAPYTWSIIGGSLPNGMTLGSTGLLSGTPTSHGSFNFTVQVMDSKGKAAQAVFSLVVDQQMWRVTAKITEVRSPWPSVGQEYDIILKMNGMMDSSHQFVDDVWIPINLTVQVDLPESALAKIEVTVDPAEAVHFGIPQTRTLFSDTPDNLEGPLSGETTIDVWPGHPTGQYLTSFKWQVSAAPL